MVTHFYSYLNSVSVKIARSIVATSGMVLILSACSSNPPVNLYAFDIPFTSTARQLQEDVASGSGVLAVRERPTLKIVLAPGPADVDSRQFSYIQQSNRINTYSVHQWADLPNFMLQPLLIDRLEASGVFAGVIGQENTLVSTDFQVNGRILRLQHEFTTVPSQARLAFRAELFDSRNRRLVATQLFEIVEPASVDTAEGGMKAAIRSVGRLLTEFTDFVVTHTHTQKATTQPRFMRVDPVM